MAQAHQTELSDVDLAATWRAGDERAYEAIVARYAPLVYHRCRRALGQNDADDATQAVFIVLARRKEQATASPLLAAWLMTVANHVIRTAQRDRQRRRRAEGLVPPPMPPPDAETLSEFQEHLDAGLADLPTAERDAITLHYLAGPSLAEVAHLTQAGLSTVKDRMQRGLERLRRSFAARGVTISAVALLAGLSAEAQAVVPELVVRQALTLNHIAGAAGQTSGHSLRAHHWSHQEPSLMSYIALAGAVVLTIGGAFAIATWSAESTPKPTNPPVAVSPSFSDLLNRTIHYADAQGGMKTVTIYELAGIIQAATGVQTTVQALDEHGIARDGMTPWADLTPGKTVRELLSASTGYWRLEPDQATLRLVPEPVEAERTHERARHKAWAYLPLDIDAGEGLTLAQLEAKLTQQLGMPVQLVPEHVERARLEMPVLEGHVRGIPARRLVGELVGKGNWNVSYESGVKMTFTPRPDVVTPSAYN